MIMDYSLLIGVHKTNSDGTSIGACGNVNSRHRLWQTRSWITTGRASSLAMLRECHRAICVNDSCLPAAPARRNPRPRAATARRSSSCRAAHTTPPSSTAPTSSCRPSITVALLHQPTHLNRFSGKLAFKHSAESPLGHPLFLWYDRGNDGWSITEALGGGSVIAYAKGGFRNPGVLNVICCSHSIPAALAPNEWMVLDSTSHKFVHDPLVRVEAPAAKSVSAPGSFKRDRMSFRNMSELLENDDDDEGPRSRTPSVKKPENPEVYQHGACLH